MVQQAILDNACRYVKPGGVLVYSTCTILPEENQQITDAFLAQHPDFSREGPLAAGSGRPDGRPSDVVAPTATTPTAFTSAACGGKHPGENSYD